MVFPCGDPLDNRNRKGFTYNRQHLLEGTIIGFGLFRGGLNNSLSPTCAPVRVAMSRIISADRSLLAYTTPSASTSLPSASVLLISTVLENKTHKSHKKFIPKPSFTPADLACKIILDAVYAQSYSDGTNKTNQVIWHIIIKGSVSLSRVECVDIIRSCGCGPNCILCEAKHCMEVILKALKRGENVIKKLCHTEKEEATMTAAVGWDKKITSPV